MVTPETSHPDVVARMAKELGWDTYTPRKIGPKYAVHDSASPIVGRADVPGLIIGLVMALGPLSIYAMGWGL